MTATGVHTTNIDSNILIIDSKRRSGVIFRTVKINKLFTHIVQMADKTRSLSDKKFMFEKPIVLHPTNDLDCKKMTMLQVN